MTDVDLKQYLDIRLDDLRADIDHRMRSAAMMAEQTQRAETLQFVAVTKATDLAREAAENRLEGLNNSYKFIRDSQADYVSTPQHEGLEKRITLLETAMANLQGRLWAIGVLVPLVITLISIAVSIGLRIFG